MRAHFANLSPAWSAAPTSLPLTPVNGIDAPYRSISDYGLTYGDGLIDTASINDGEILNTGAHFALDRRNCQRLGVACLDVSSLATDTLTITLALDRLIGGLTITRDSGASGYTPGVLLYPACIVAYCEWPTAHSPHKRNGVSVCIANHRLRMKPKLAGFTFLNRVGQVMASRELAETTAQGGRILDDIRTMHDIVDRNWASQTALIARDYHR